MSNEELAALVQAGDRERLAELWEQIRRLVLQQARRWAAGEPEPVQGVVGVSVSYPPCTR